MATGALEVAQNEKSPAISRGGRRLLSIDVVRGMTIVFMIMVNNSSQGSWGFMKHAEWNGLTPTDLVFPTFLFLVGMAVAFSFDARLERGEPRGRVARHTLRRAALLFLFGVFVNGFPFFHLGELRIYGVLQRIAICYAVVGLLYLWDRRVPSKLLILAGCLIGYWVLVRFVPVPGYGMPVRDVPLLDPDGNIVAWLDRLLMPGRLYEKTRDPEGLLSTIPAVGTALLGLLSGAWLRSARNVREKLNGLLAMCAACLALGYVWSVWFPLNKKMWTSSYVLVAGGYSLLLLAACYFAVEIKEWRGRWTVPWVIFGSNAIAAYMISEIVPPQLWSMHVWSEGRRLTVPGYVFAHWLSVIADPGWRAFGWSVLCVLMCFVPVWVLWRKRVFLKL